MKNFKTIMTIEHDDGEVEHIGGFSFQTTDVDPSVNDANVSIAWARILEMGRDLVTEIRQSRQLGT